MLFPSNAQETGIVALVFLSQKNVCFKRIAFVSLVHVVIIRRLNFHPNIMIASVYFPP